MLALAPIENTPYVGGIANAIHWSDASGLQKTDANLTWDATNGLTVGKPVNVGDTNTYISKDGSNNMTFTDAVTGTLTLAEMSCPPKIEATETSVAEGNNNVALGASKVLIKWLRVTTTSTDWTLTIYTKDDYATKPMEIVTSRNGNYDLYFDYPYEDEDASDEFHYNFASASGSETHNITILGYKLR